MPWQQDLFDVELDFIYENNSVVDAFDVVLEDVVLDPLLPPVTRRLTVPHNYNDSFGLRLGGSAHFLNGMLTASLGASWDSGGIPDEWTRLDYLNWQRFGLALGVTFRYSLIEITVAYQHMFLLERDVSLPAQADPRSPDYDEDFDVCTVRACALSAMSDYEFGDAAINTGHYEASQDILSISLGFRWGEGSGGLRDRSDDEPPQPVPTDAAPPQEPASGRDAAPVDEPAQPAPTDSTTTPAADPAPVDQAVAPVEASAPVEPPPPQPAPVE
jgi:hypothetical protein